jgi:hypothetical protein
LSCRAEADEASVTANSISTAARWKRVRDALPCGQMPIRLGGPGFGPAAKPLSKTGFSR